MIVCLTLNKQPVLENRLSDVTVMSDDRVSDSINRKPALKNRLNIVTVISDDRASDSKQPTCAREQTQHCHGDIK